ncbi:MAG: T9SS type A sorting domain-containing protein [Bacteroidetes bacterium]|nr:T9SS C-terminal target domain-containing protein [Bacteroidota bacterium]NOG58213.1 T9SS type A sorting domain-containing protein [Bacteroidota bacterium]
MKAILNILLVLISLSSLAQGSFSPAVGEVGCTAIHKDSSIIKAWAKQCTIQRGYLNILDKTLANTSVGDSTKALGIADNLVVSLGDSGVATVTFEGKIFNGPGFDFAVYENGHDNYFLELAFVEVSSDGINYTRFPAQSETDTSAQVKSFDSLDARNIHNLAGKYRLYYGVPFDLEDLKGTPNLDLDQITHIRIVDVVGTMNPNFASRDHIGRKVNDPFPTAFPSGGFDLDAVAAIYIKPTSIEEFTKQTLLVFPNPSQGVFYFSDSLNGSVAKVFSMDGKLVFKGAVINSELDLSFLKTGYYQILILNQDKVSIAKVKIE